MLNKPECKVEFDENGKACGVTSEGETAKCEKVVCDPSYLLDKVVVIASGAYLMSLSDALMWGMTQGAVYLTVMVGVSLGQLQLFVGQTFASDVYLLVKKFHLLQTCMFL